MDEILKALMEFLKEASPMVWNALVRQVYAQAVGYIVGAVLALTVSIALWLSGPRFAEAVCDDGAKYHLRAFALGIFLISVGLSVSAWMRFYNPDYYAIQIILEALGR